MARPAEFNRADVLEKAMQTFWLKGYTATSVTDLVKATGLKPGSLYGAFHSKRGLFMEVIDTYAAISLNRVEDCITGSQSPLDAVWRLFDSIGNTLCSDTDGKGCLLVNTLLELASEDEQVRQTITGYLAEVEALLSKQLAAAQQQQQIAADANPETIAKFLMTGIWGLRVLSSTRPAQDQYQQIIQQLLNSIPVTKAA